MQITQSFTLAAALALGLVSAEAFAAKPMPRSIPVSQTNTTAVDTSSIVVTRIRKVYAFSYLDKNHNGQLSRAELPHDMHNLRRNFVRADFNENGQISPREYLMFARGQAPAYLPNKYIFVYGPNDLKVADIETPE